MSSKRLCAFGRHMEQQNKESLDIRSIIRGAVEEFVRTEQVKAEPAYKAELLEERKRREQLEQKMNDLVQENQRTRLAADVIPGVSSEPFC